MKLLPPEQYDIATYPLKNVSFHNLFARSVIEKHVGGTVYVDNIETPGTFYVIHPYGMSLLFGNFNNNFVNNDLKDYLLLNNSLRNQKEWLQIYPTKYEDKIDKMLGETNNVVIKHKRVNFKLNRDKYQIFKREHLTENYNIIEVDNKAFNEIDGGVVPNKFWDKWTDFSEKGIGFSLLMAGEKISTAFSSFRHDNLLDIGVETKPEFQKRGFAKYVCSKIIDYCLINGTEPLWACQKDNYGSCNLARRLGFEPTVNLPYYELRARGN